MDITKLIPENILVILEQNPNIGRGRLSEMAEIPLGMARRYVHIWKKMLNAPVEAQEPIFLDKKTEEDVDWRDMLDTIRAMQKTHNKLSTSQDEATIQLPDKKNIIIFSADWHLGSVATDYDMFRENIELLLSTENCYLVTVGDVIDNFRRFYSLEAVFSQVASPKMQTQILRAIYDELTAKHKWLAGCWGDHDVKWDETAFGQSPVKEMLSKKIVYFNGKGILNLKLGEEKYEIVLSHKLMGNSIYNPNHPQIRESKWYHPNADVIVSAHKHNPAIQILYEYGKRKCFVQVGTFKVDDGYSKRFWEKGIIGVPALVFHNDRHEVGAYMSLGEYLEK